MLHLIIWTTGLKIKR